MTSKESTAVSQSLTYEFADLLLDTHQRAVFRGDVRIPLPRLTYQFLLTLVEAAPGLLSAEELSKRVWSGRTLTPETLAQRVSLLRESLGDAASNPRYLRVVRGLGYQLIPQVRVRQKSGALLSSTSGSRTAEFDNEPGATIDIDLGLPAQPSIVVLPFDSDEEPEHSNFARGLTHDITTRIARTRSFFVIARGTAFRFSPGNHDARDISRKLGVRYVVQGNIQFDGSSVRINTALVDGVEGREICAENFTRQFKQLFDAQEEITDVIVGTISTEIEVAERQRAFLETPASLDAWSAYHRGCWHMYRFTPFDYQQAQHYLEKSLYLDPNSSRAFAALSFVHWQRAFLEISLDRLQESRQTFELALQSVSLNIRDPLAHWALGRAYLLRGDMPQALEELNIAIELNPSFAVGQYTLGFVQMLMGNTEQSIARALKAQRLSPFDPMNFAMRGLQGFSLALAGQYKQAAQHMALSVKQPNAHYHMVAMAAVCDMLEGNEQSARQSLSRLRDARPDYGAKAFLLAFPFQQTEHRKLVEDAFRQLLRLK